MSKGAIVVLTHSPRMVGPCSTCIRTFESPFNTANVGALEAENVDSTRTQRVDLRGERVLGEVDPAQQYASLSQ